MSAEFRFTKKPGSAFLYFGDEFVAKFSGAHRKAFSAVLDEHSTLRASSAQMATELATICGAVHELSRRCGLPTAINLEEWTQALVTIGNLVERLRADLAAAKERAEKAESEKDEAIIKYTGQADTAEQHHKECLARVELLRAESAKLQQALEQARAAIKEICHEAFPMIPVASQWNRLSDLGEAALSACGDATAKEPVSPWLADVEELRIKLHQMPLGERNGFADALGRLGSPAFLRFFRKLATAPLPPAPESKLDATEVVE